MSAETDFRAALAAHGALTALVGTRIAQNVVPDGSALPFVTFSSRHDPEVSMDSTTAADRITFETQCWAKTSASADAVADAVAAAIVAHDNATASITAVVIQRESAYDGELGLDAVVLTVEWWQ